MAAEAWLSLSLPFVIKPFAARQNPQGAIGGREVHQVEKFDTTQNHHHRVQHVRIAVSTGFRLGFFIFFFFIFKFVRDPAQLFISRNQVFLALITL